MWSRIIVSRSLLLHISNRTGKVVAYADSVIVVEKGSIVRAGPAQDILQDDAVSSLESVDESDSEPEAKEEPSSTPDYSRQRGGLSVYWYYLSQSGLVPLVLFTICMVVWMFSGEFSSRFCTCTTPLTIRYLDEMVVRSQ